MIVARYSLIRRSTASLALTLAMLAGAGASAQPAKEQVRSLAEREKPAAIETLRALVGIESGSKDEAGLKAIADRLERELRDVGAAVERSPAPPSPGDMIVARLDGTGTRKILFLAHMDTVYPSGALQKEPFRIEGERAYGPGIADDKSGLVNVLHMLKILRALDYRSYGRITVAFNPDEEVGSRGSRDRIRQLAAEHDVVLSCEPGGRQAAIALATSGIAGLTLEVKGRAAHAGNAPDAGRNALVELSQLILKTRDLSEPERGLKFNWTLARAGSALNVIPAEAQASADIRYLEQEDLDRVIGRFEERIRERTVPDTEVSYRLNRGRPPLKPTAASRAVGDLARRVYAELGLDLLVSDHPAGGGTDAAYAALSGKPVVEGFGFGGWGYHGGVEYVDLETIAPRLYLLSRMVIEASQGALAP